MTAETPEVAILVEPDRVVMEGDEWVREIVHDVAFSGTEHIDEFNNLFEIDKKAHLGSEDYYQGLDFMRLIRRKSDGRLFGYPFWDSPGNDAMEGILEPNGDDHGFEATFNDDYTEYVRGPFWVWLPVEPFAITGYRIPTTQED